MYLVVVECFLKCIPSLVVQCNGQMQPRYHHQVGKIKKSSRPPTFPARLNLAFGQTLRLAFQNQLEVCC